MSGRNIKKARNTHEKVRKRLVLIITDDPSMTASKAESRLQADSENIMIQVICTDLKGKKLEKAVKLYIRDNDINISSNDELLYWNSNKGGGVDECNLSE